MLIGFESDVKIAIEMITIKRGFWNQKELKLYSRNQKPMKTQIEVKTGFFFMAWLLYFCTPVITINGEMHRRKWGYSSFDLAPGIYNIKIYFPYIMKPECGANRVTIELKEGESKLIKYNMPPWMFSKGKITVS